MNSGYRSKLFLYVLLTAVIVYVAYNYLLKPQLAKQSTLANEVSSLNVQLQQLKDKKLHFTEYEDELKQIEEKKKEFFKQYPLVLYEEDLIDMLKKFRIQQQGKIDVAIQQISEPKSLQIGNAALNMMDFSYSFNSNYRGFEDTFDKLLKTSPRITISNFTLGSKGGDSLTVNMSLQILGYKDDMQKPNAPQYKLNGPKSKINLFLPN